jgi:hypothetical protein
LEHFAGAHGPLGGNALLVKFLGADRISQADWAVDDLQYRDIRFAADFEAADAILPANRACGVDRALGDNLMETQA